MSAAQWVIFTTPTVRVCEETAGEMLTSGLKPKTPYPLSSLQKWQYTMYRLLNDSSVSFAVTLLRVFVLWVCSACNSSHATLCLLIVCVSAVPVCWRHVCVCVCPVASVWGHCMVPWLILHLVGQAFSCRRLCFASGSLDSWNSSKLPSNHLRVMTHGCCKPEFYFFNGMFWVQYKLSVTHMGALGKYRHEVPHTSNHVKKKKENKRIYCIPTKVPVKITAILMLKNIFIKILPVTNQHIIMIFEASCNNKNWPNGCKKFSFAIPVINYMLKQYILKY